MGARIGYVEEDRLGALEHRVAHVEALLEEQAARLAELLTAVREHFIKCPGHEDGDPLP